MVVAGEDVIDVIKIKKREWERLVAMYLLMTTEFSSQRTLTASSEFCLFLCDPCQCET